MQARKRYLTLIVAALLLMSTCAAVGQVGARAPQTVGEQCTPIEPEYKPGNPKCAETCGGTEFKIEAGDVSTFAGTYDVGGGKSITIAVTKDGGEEVGIDWSSNFPIGCVIMKGGPNANVYYYNPPAQRGCGLETPINPSNDKNYGISHISFCYTDSVVEILPLEVSKTANTSYTRTYGWTIDKSVNPADLDVTYGPGTAEYTVALTKDAGTDSDWAVSGTITIHNPETNPAATITGISDVISEGIAATGNWPGDLATQPITLEPGATVQYTYSAGLPDGSNRTNTVTVATSGSVPGASATANVTFGAPAEEKYASVTVTDTYSGSGAPWTFSSSGTQTYTRSFDCDDAGTYENTATIVETGASDSATVNVRCDHCDLVISKTVKPSYTRTYEWDITKSVDRAVVDVSDGEATVGYTVVVTRSAGIDSDWLVTGVITITNPTDYDAVITGISDVLSDGTVATGNWPGDLASNPMTLAAGETVEFAYTAAPSSGAAVENTITVTTTGHVKGGSTTVPFSFGAPAEEKYARVTVTDTYAGSGAPWTFTGSGTKTYSRTFDCDDEGTVVNTATIVETDQSDSATVLVTCEEPGPFALQVSKTASTSYTRTYDWTIDKSVDRDHWDLTGGKRRTSTYTIKVTRTGYTDGNWRANGTILIHNPEGNPTARIESISDVLSGGISATVHCPVALPYDLAPGATIECSYTAGLPNGADRVNTVVVTTSGKVSGGSATADVKFDKASVSIVNDKIHVDDSLGGSWAFEDSGTVVYHKTFDCGDAGKIVNTATIRETGQKDSVTVRVDCGKQQSTPTPSSTPVPGATPVFILPVTGSDPAPAGGASGLIGFVWGLWQIVAYWWRSLFSL